ncbi:hypothetical protein TCSYLVIO_001336 [Trypanosoma cruzi]|nr:hypothetical protein TCSYLVIO_001336 [Trypanosoma cruzi]
MKMHLGTHNVKEFWTTVWKTRNTGWRLGERSAPFTRILFAFLKGAGILSEEELKKDPYDAVLCFLAGKTVFAPLCGDSAIISYMVGCRVKRIVGVDLSEQALSLQCQVNFPNVSFKTTRLDPVEGTTGDFVVHEASVGDSRVTFFQGDLLQLPCFKAYSELKVEFMYDRASMMAIPPDIRGAYVQAVTRVFRANTTVAYERMVRVLPEERHWGPPFMVDMDEVLQMYRESTGREYRATRVLADEMEGTLCPEWYAIVPHN